jgi:WD40 repeat protein
LLAAATLQGYILKCLISPDVQQLATTSSDKTVKLWNLDGFTLDRTLTGHTRWVWDCVFSVDAAYLVTASSDATARLWDLSTGACSGAAVFGVWLKRQIVYVFICSRDYRAQCAPAAEKNIP